MNLRLILYVFMCLVFNNLKTYSINNTEEVSKIEASSVFKKHKDSVFSIEYDNLLKGYKAKKYAATLNEALLLFDKVKNKDSLNFVTILIADIYDKTNNYSKALKYYKKSLDFLNYRKLLDKKDSILLENRIYAKTLLRIGSEFQKLAKIDSAIYYYSMLEKSTSLNTEVLKFKAVSFSNLSGIYEKDSLFDKAKEYANKAIAIHKNTGNKANEAIAKNNLANIYLSLGDFSTSKRIYLEGIELIKNDNSTDAVRFKASLYYNLAWAMRNLKDYKAYDFQELSYEIEDDVRDKEVRAMIETITAKYNVNTVKKDEENKRLKHQRIFLLLGIGGAIIILSLLFWVNYYKLKQKNLGLQLSQSQLIQNQRLEHVKSESQSRVLNATIDGKESERKQIAETLHDSVSALLSSANLHLQAARTQLNGNIPVEIDKTQLIIAEASQKIRDLSHTLVSSVLLKFGLKYAINDMADKYSNSKIEIITDIGEINRRHQNCEIKVYNIIQEFVNNILKHSMAKNAIIKLEEVNNKLCLTISDNGIGFDKTKALNKEGLGLNQIEARVQMMKGDFYIESSINMGTVIKVIFPLLEKEQINLV